MAYTFGKNYPLASRNRGGYVVTPPTTDFCLVFPYDRKSNTFDKSFYSPALTHGKVSFQQLDSFIGEAERILKKKIDPVKKVWSLFGWFALLGVVFIACLMFTMMSDDLDDDYNSDSMAANIDDSDEVDSLFIVLMGYMFGIIFYALICGIYSCKKHRKARKAIQTLVDRNSQMFAAQGLRWNVPKYFPRWIELWKDYRGQQAQCMCGQMLQPYDNFTTLNQGQIIQNQYQQYPQQDNQQLQIQVQPQYTLQIPSNIRTYSNKPLGQPLLNTTQNQEIGQYVPPNSNNYPSLDN